MKKKTVGVAVMLLVGLVIGVSVNVNQHAPAVAPLAEVVKADLMTVWSAYQRNAADADARYGGGRTIETTGPVVTVAKRKGEVGLFLFDLDLQGERPARALCLFPAREFPDLARLVKRAPVTVRGKASWMPECAVGPSVVLHDCVLVSTGN
jgi:hypothetical protein